MYTRPLVIECSRRFRLVAAALLAVALLAGCADTVGPSAWSLGASSDTDDTGACRHVLTDDGDADETCELPNDPVETREACGTTVYGSPDQFDGEAREHPALEVMALEHADTMTAPDCLYRRLERDVTAIGERFEGGLTPKYAASHDGRSLRLNVDRETAQAIENGTHEAFDCLQAHYGEARTEVEQTEEGGGVLLFFDSVRDMERVARSYRDLSGVVERDGSAIEFPNIDLNDDFGVRTSQRQLNDICLNVDGNTHEYLVDQRWGDCVGGGCRQGRTRYFTSTTSGRLCKRGDSRDEPDNLPDESTICD